MRNGDASAQRGNGRVVRVFRVASVDGDRVCCREVGSRDLWATRSYGAETPVTCGVPTDCGELISNTNISLSLYCLKREGQDGAWLLLIMASSQIPAPAPIASDGSFNTYAQLDQYPWDTDAEFQGGLNAILGPSPSPEQAADLTLHARCFYFSR